MPKASRVHPSLKSTINAGNSYFDVCDDMEGEREAMQGLDVAHVPSPKLPQGIAQHRQVIANASKGVTNKTYKEYLRIEEQMGFFLVKWNLVKTPGDFFCEKPPVDSPDLIIAYIMHECDTTYHDGTVKSEGTFIGTYSYAQKIRAAMTTLFGRKYRLGNADWFQDPDAEVTRGNPSVSSDVSQFMLGLRNRKNRAGEKSTSARAITSNILRQLYDFNHRSENWDLRDYKQGSHKKSIHDWGGPMLRRELQAIYLLAFLCLLRSDEVLNIRWEHLQFSVDKEDRHAILTLALPFRKTHPEGGIKPFVLHMFPDDDIHLCAVTALADWVEASQLTSGYIFHKMGSNDRPSPEDIPMTSEQFLEYFRNNLLDIGVDQYPYGTHSFRRGGVQYLAGNERRWPLRRICEWGGWSEELTSNSILKYIISWNDDPTEEREDFFNPRKKPTIKCPACGRSCLCS